MVIVAPLGPPAPPGFTRAFGRATVFGFQRGVTVPLVGAYVRAYVPGTDSTWPDPLYDDEGATAPAHFPLFVDGGGSVSLWAAEPCRVELACSMAGYETTRVVLDIEFPPDYEDPDLATDEEIADALAAHEGALDPHPTYLTEPEATALFLPLAHAPGGDPHPQYLTEPEGDSRYALLGGSGITQDQADLRYVNITGDAVTGPLTAPNLYTKSEVDALLAAATARITTLEGQVATLQAQMTGHTHQTGTVQQIAAAATMP